MKLIECPRDAMQGIEKFIPTELKVKYLNQLLKVGFDTIDAGSFVSPKAIPQMRDTEDVLRQLEKGNSKTRLLVIVANVRGAQNAAMQTAVNDIGFPLSLSETFQQRNTNKSIGEALSMLDEMKEICLHAGKNLVVYLSMGFGNPYGDPFTPDVVLKFVDILKTMGIRTISVADTVGVANPVLIHDLFTILLRDFPSIEFGAHLHAAPSTALEKIDAAYSAGCRRFDGTLKGFGGCPMAEDKLVGNIATEAILSYLTTRSDVPSLEMNALAKASMIAEEIFLGSYNVPA